jgi:hypothetical protein
MKIAVLFSAFLLLLLGCDPSQRALIDNLKDDDQDGWFYLERNESLELIVTFLQVDRFDTRFTRPFSMVVDDVFLADNSTSIQNSKVLTRRALGKWKLEQDELRQWYNSEVEFFAPGTSFDINNSLKTNIAWNNLDSTRQIVIRAEEMTFFFEIKVVRTFFADVRLSAQADFDADGITDIKEAYLAKQNKRVGHLQHKDIVLLAAHTHPDWKITNNSRYLLTDRFREHGFNLFIIHRDGQLNGAAPREIVANENLPMPFGSRLFHPTDAHVGFAKRQCVSDTTLMPVLRTCLLADDLDELFLFGKAIGIPGRDFRVQSHLPFPLGPDFKNYQAGLIMHELGHTIGLCHPVSGTGFPSCPSLPAEEARNDASIMGAPVESAGPIEAVFETLDRPIDYSPTQWTSIDLSGIRTLPF